MAIDKAQKQLVDTYVRKREIATGDYGYGYDTNRIQPYELLYLMKTNQVNPEKAKSSSFGQNIVELLKHNPDTYNDPDIQKYLPSLSLGNKGNIIAHRQEFIDIFKNDINEFYPASIKYILQRQPQFANKFDLNKLGITDAMDLLAKQPQFIEIPKFAKYLRELVSKSENDYWKSDFWRKMKGMDIYMRNNGGMNEEEYSKQHKKFIDAVVKYPIFRELFSDKLKEDSRSTDMIDLLKRDETLLPYFDLSIPKEYVLGDLLEIHPEVINKISKEQIDTLRLNWEIPDILAKQPQLRPYFEHIINPKPVKNYGSIRKQIENDDRFTNLRQYLSNGNGDVTPDGIRKLKNHFEENQRTVRNNREYDMYNGLIDSVDKLLDMFDK